MGQRRKCGPQLCKKQSSVMLEIEESNKDNENIRTEKSNPFS
jgi:hypothetical protein